MQSQNISGQHYDQPHHSANAHLHHLHTQPLPTLQLPPKPRAISLFSFLFSLNSATSHLNHNYTWQPRARREKQWAAIDCCSCPRRRSERENEGENRVWASVCIFQLQTTALQHSSLQHHPSCNHCNQNLCEPRAERENRKFFRFLVSELQSEVTSELD